MANDDLNIHVRLTGARQAGADAKHLRAEVVSIAGAEDKVAASARRMGGAHARAEKQTRGLGHGFIYARKGLGPLRAGVTGLTGALGFGAGVGLIGALNTMKNEARDAQLTNKATAAVLHSTGAEAWTSAKHVYDYASSLSNVTAVDNQVIQKATNMLLTFRDIRNESGRGNAILDRSTKAALNLSVAFEAAGKSLSPTDAALQLGKAINDPVKGMGRLQRIGVTFNKQQVDQVTKMTNANNVLGAQKVILKELDKEFGGAAKSQADPLKKLNVIYKNLAEQIGLKLMPYISKAATALGKFVTQMQTGKGAGGDFRRALVDIWHAAKPVVVWFGRAAINIAKFAGKHPGLVKVAAALFLASKALKLMRFASAIRGAALLWGAFNKIVASKFGARIAKEVVSNVGGIPGKLAGFRSRFALIGKLAGAAYVASFIAQLLNLPKEADPLLILHPPSAGDPRPGHGDIVSHHKKVGKPYRVKGHTYQNYLNMSTGTQTAERVNKPMMRLPPRTPRVALATPGAQIPTPAATTDPTVIHNVLQVDGKTIWESWDKHDRNQRARR